MGESSPELCVVGDGLEKRLLLSGECEVMATPCLDGMAAGDC